MIIRLFPRVAAALIATIPLSGSAMEPSPCSKAETLLQRMTTEEKLSLVSGYNSFYIHGISRLGIPEIYMSDATQGVHIRKELPGQLEKSVSFPSPLCLAATWNTELAHDYARSVGEECKAGGISVLLGPGVNIYRNSQCGRNFEYFGEDPYLCSRIAEAYVRGVLEVGVVPTLKHFIANDAEYHRRTSNSRVDERALFEIHLAPFKACIDAGAPAVMTAYNQLNGEWCGESHHAITDLLRGALSFRGLVMTDWSSVYDAAKLIKSGQDLEMPGEALIAKNAKRLLAEGKIGQEDIDRMVRSILKMELSAGLLDSPAKDEKYLACFSNHRRVALQTAREGIVLLKNSGILPFATGKEGRRILVTGAFVESLAKGGGAADVEGFEVASLRAALVARFGTMVSFVPTPTDLELAEAPLVLLSTGTLDGEGTDRPFDLPAEEEQKIRRTVSLNRNTVVVVNSGGGINMSGWCNEAAAIVYAWYPGQEGNKALAEILAGDINPSGKLPMTIERCFENSPAFGYVPSGEELYSAADWKARNDTSKPVYTVDYKEGVFVGYRWYDRKGIAPLYRFGEGLSYTTFEYGRMDIRNADPAKPRSIRISCQVMNTGKRQGAETLQLYVRPLGAPVPRPDKELKGFRKMGLEPGQTKEVLWTLTERDFSYWDPAVHGWVCAPGDYEILVGESSGCLPLKAKISLR